MTFCSSNSVQKDWNSLISQNTDKRETEGIRGVIEIYTDTIKNMHTTSQIKNLSIFRRVFRNHYMEALIVNKKDVKEELQAVSTLFGEKSLFDDIDKLYALDFNPRWSIGYAYLAAYFRFKSLKKREDIKKILKGTNDGINDLSLLNEDPLLAYRAIHSIEEVIANSQKQKVALLAKAIEVFGKIDKKINEEEEDIDSLSKFDQTFYYLTILLNHQKFRDNFHKILNLFFKDSRNVDPNEKRILTLTPDDLASALLSSDEKVQMKALEILNHLRQGIDRSYFCILFENTEGVVLNERVRSLKEPLLANSPRRSPRHLQLFLFKLCLKNHLPREYRKEITPKMVKEAIKEESKETLIKLLEIAVWLKKTSNSYINFSHEILGPDSDRLAFKIKEFDELLINKKKQKVYLKDSWDLLAHGNPSKKELKMMVDDLTMEQARLFRLVQLKDIDDRLAEYEINPFNQIAQISQSAEFISPRLERKGENVELIEQTSLDLAVQHYNNFMNLIVYEIISSYSRSFKEAEGIIGNFLNLAKIALDSEKPNLHLAYAVIAAFSTSSISRLHLFDNLEPKYAKIYKKLEELFSPEHGYRDYREYLLKSSHPSLPSLPIYQKQLTLALEAPQTKEQKKEISYLCDEINKVQFLMKICHPMRPERSDFEKSVKFALPIAELKAPDKKIDIGEICDFRPGEWENLPTWEKLYFFSTWTSFIEQLPTH